MWALAPNKELLIDPTVTQQWYDSNGRYRPTHAAPAQDALRAATSIYMAFRRSPGSAWVGVAIVPHPAQSRVSIFIFNTATARARLFDVESPVGSLCDETYPGFHQAYFYPSVSVYALQSPLFLSDKAFASGPKNSHLRNAYVGVLCPLLYR